jgi:hypothetical protein
MEVLNKIGEFFFDDGEAEEDERKRLAYAKYKASKKLQKERGRGFGSSSARIRSSSRDGRADQRDDDDDEDRDELRHQHSCGTPSSKRSAAPPSEEETSSTACIDTASAATSVSTPFEDDQTQDNLAALVPVTICANLSMPTVSSRSNISDSGSSLPSPQGSAGSATMQARNQHLLIKRQRNHLNKYSIIPGRKFAFFQQEQQQNPQQDDHQPLSQMGCCMSPSAAYTRTTATSMSMKMTESHMTETTEYEEASTVNLDRMVDQLLEDMSPAEQDEEAEQEEARTQATRGSPYSNKKSENTGVSSFHSSQAVSSSALKQASSSKSRSFKRANAEGIRSRSSSFKSRDSSQSGRSSDAESSLLTEEDDLKKLSILCSISMSPQKDVATPPAGDEVPKRIRLLKTTDGSVVAMPSKNTPSSSQSKDAVSFSEQDIMAQLSSKTTKSKAIHGWIESSNDGDDQGEKIELAISCSSTINDIVEATEAKSPTFASRLLRSPRSPRSPSVLSDTERTAKSMPSLVSARSVDGIPFTTKIQVKEDIAKPTMNKPNKGPKGLKSLLKMKLGMKRFPSSPLPRSPVVFRRTSNLECPQSSDPPAHYLSPMAQTTENDTPRSQDTGPTLQSHTTSALKSQGTGQFFTTELMLEDPKASLVEDAYGNMKPNALPTKGSQRTPKSHVTGPTLVDSRSTLRSHASGLSFAEQDIMVLEEPSNTPQDDDDTAMKSATEQPQASLQSNTERRRPKGNDEGFERLLSTSRSQQTAFSVSQRTSGLPRSSSQSRRSTNSSAQSRRSTKSSASAATCVSLASSQKSKMSRCSQSYCHQRPPMYPTHNIRMGYSYDETAPSIATSAHRAGMASYLDNVTITPSSSSPRSSSEVNAVEVSLSGVPKDFQYGPPLSPGCSEKSATSSPVQSASNMGSDSATEYTTIEVAAVYSNRTRSTKSIRKTKSSVSFAEQELPNKKSVGNHDDEMTVNGSDRCAASTEDNDANDGGSETATENLTALGIECDDQPPTTGARKKGSFFFSPRMLQRKKTDKTPRVQNLKEAATEDYVPTETSQPEDEREPEESHADASEHDARDAFIKALEQCQIQTDFDEGTKMTSSTTAASAKESSTKGDGTNAHGKTAKTSHKEKKSRPNLFSRKPENRRQRSLSPRRSKEAKSPRRTNLFRAFSLPRIHRPIPKQNSDELSSMIVHQNLDNHARVREFIEDIGQDVRLWEEPPAPKEKSRRPSWTRQSSDSSNIPAAALRAQQHEPRLTDEYSSGNRGTAASYENPWHAAGHPDYKNPWHAAGHPNYKAPRLPTAHRAATKYKEKNPWHASGHPNYVDRNRQAIDYENPWHAAGHPDSIPIGTNDRQLAERQPSELDPATYHPEDRKAVRFGEVHELEISPRKKLKGLRKFTAGFKEMLKPHRVDPKPTTQPPFPVDEPRFGVAPGLVADKRHPYTLSRMQSGDTEDGFLVAYHQLMHNPLMLKPTWQQSHGMVEPVIFYGNRRAALPPQRPLPPSTNEETNTAATSAWQANAEEANGNEAEIFFI